MAFEIVVPDWLDKQLIEQALREEEKNNKINVKMIKVWEVNSANDKYSSSLYRLTVEYHTHNDCDSPVSTKSIVVKAFPNTDHGEQIVIENNTFTTETEVLARIIPAFQRLLCDCSSERAVTFAPKCFYSTGEPHSLVLQDLRQVGFKIAQGTSGLDLDHSMLAVSRIGMFHAASVALHRQDPKSFDNFLFYPSLDDKDATRELLKYSFDAVADNVKSRPEVGPKYSEMLRHFGESAFQLLEEVVQRDEEGFNVLNHGDFWINHVMFRYDGSGAVSDIKFVDFQNCYYGSPVIDLQYFLYSSPSPEVRSDHTDRLLEWYHSSLSETLARLGCGDLCPSFEDIRLEMDKRSFMGLITAVCVMPVVFSSADGTSDDVAQVPEEPEDHSETDCSSCHIPEKYTDEIMRLLPTFEIKCPVSKANV
ncbi:uncharacterized protein LOC134533773 [Bacillus rossius redtenbacheri]|uniref:uncharacterized protein LOC134533773 n=1 Tax=Bacillus rossius redtenbacheri TaxID=93214 RepID=UPI002FDE9864